MIETLMEMLQANNPFLIIIAGLMIGLVHAFEPDHLSAVSTQLLKNNKNSTNSKKQGLRSLTISSSLRGVFWGMGHTSSIILIGLLIAGLSLNIPNDFFLSAEMVVGFMLIVLGVFTFTNKSIFKQKHIHPHKHSNGIAHTHSHNHGAEHKHGHKSYLIGCIHGIAGTGSLVALIASTMNGFDVMMYFLILFGIGSIIGMTVASGIIGLPFILLSKISSATKYLRYIIAGITFVIGINIVFTIGLDSKLFLN
ncbi:MAG: high frequency lysogenization protein HflD [Nitrosopumilus sp.]|nr:high frequency lysogenization protein HflD [Nitrosopumilus sp.]MDC4231147.1 high frequency lysogenization protein HflD [Nitrosopumilus sp.]